MTGQPPVKLGQVAFIAKYQVFGVLRDQLHITDRITGAAAFFAASDSTLLLGSLSSSKVLLAVTVRA